MAGSNLAKENVAKMAGSKFGERINVAKIAGRRHAPSSKSKSNAHEHQHHHLLAFEFDELIGMALYWRWHCMAL